MNTTFPLSGKTFCRVSKFSLYKMVSVEARSMLEEDKKTITKRKNFPWTDEMVEQLTDFLNVYNSEIEFKCLDFDADKCSHKMAMA